MPPRRRRQPAPLRLAQLAASASPSTICTVVGTVLWLSTALSEGHLVPGLGGFLPQISVLWYVGVVLLIVAIALAGKESEPHVAVPSSSSSPR